MDSLVINTCKTVVFFMETHTLKTGAELIDYEEVRNKVLKVTRSSECQKIDGGKTQDVTDHIACLLFFPFKLMLN